MDINEAVNKLFEQERALMQELTSSPLLPWHPSPEGWKPSDVSPQSTTPERKTQSDV